MPSPVEIAFSANQAKQFMKTTIEYLDEIGKTTHPNKKIELIFDAMFTMQMAMMEVIEALFNIADYLAEKEGEEE